MTNFPVTRSPKEDRERCPYSWTLSRQFLLPQTQASQLPGFLTLTNYLSGAGNSAICFLPLKFYISNHWTKKHFSLGPYWSLKCSALSQSVKQGRSERPSSALVALDIKYNWVDKSSMLPYEYLLHLLSFWRGWGTKKKSDKWVLSLATVHRHFVSSYSFDNVVRDFFFSSSCWCKENLRFCPLLFALGLICNHHFLHPGKCLEIGLLDIDVWWHFKKKSCQDRQGLFHI